MDWEKKYHWVTCKNPADEMFCAVCQKWGKPPAGTRGAWTIKGVVDWNYTTELSPLSSATVHLFLYPGQPWHATIIIYQIDLGTPRCCWCGKPWLKNHMQHWFELSKFIGYTFRAPASTVSTSQFYTVILGTNLCICPQHCYSIIIVFM